MQESRAIPALSPSKITLKPFGIDLNLNNPPTDSFREHLSERAVVGNSFAGKKVDGELCSRIQTVLQLAQYVIHARQVLVEPFRYAGPDAHLCAVFDRLRNLANDDRLVRRSKVRGLCSSNHPYRRGVRDKLLRVLLFQEFGNRVLLGVSEVGAFPSVLVYVVPAGQAHRRGAVHPLNIYHGAVGERHAGDGAFNRTKIDTLPVCHRDRHRSDGGCYNSRLDGLLCNRSKGHGRLTLDHALSTLDCSVDQFHGSDLGQSQTKPSSR